MLINSTLILMSLLAALIELDTTYLFQTLLSRPIIAGPIFGLCIGDPMAGIQVGIFAELLFSDISPLGGIIPPSGVIATVVPVTLHAMGIELYFGFFCGVFASVLYSFLDALLRKTRFTWMIFLETKIGKRPNAIQHTLASTVLLSFLVTFVFVSVATWASAQIMFLAFPYIPARVHFAFQLAYAAVPWLGLAALIPTFRLKTR